MTFVNNKGELKKLFTMKTETNNRQNTISFNFPELAEVNSKLDILLEKIDYLIGYKNELAKVLTTSDVLKILNICPKTLQKYRNEGKITFTKVGMKLFYKQSDIDTFIKTNQRYRICG